MQKLIASMKNKNIDANLILKCDGVKITNEIQNFLDNLITKHEENANVLI